MKKFQVLIAAMNQDDFSLLSKMNLKCDSIIANQTNRESVDLLEEDDVTSVMISTKTRGVGKNRNIALDHADGEIILFADDDMLYYDCKLQGVLEAFKECKDADVIIFSLEYKKQNQVYRTKYLETKELRFSKALRYGAAAIAAKRSSIGDIRFNENFGGGCIYSSGEDSLFIKDCFDKGLKVYTHAYILGSTNKDNSTWFEGYNEKFFYDKGALMRFLFPRGSLLMTLWYSLKFRTQTELSFFKRIKLMLAGRKYSRELLSYQDYLMR